MFARLLLFYLAFFTLCVHADPYSEADFEKLRDQIRKASSESPSAAMLKTDAILEAHEEKLSVRQKIRLLYGKAWFQIQTEDLDSAFATLAYCKQRSSEVSDPTILFSYYSLTAGAFTRIAMYERALENYLESYQIAGLMDTQQYLRQTENNIGNVYLKMERFEDAKNYFERFYQDAVERDLPSQMSVGLNNLGESAFGVGEYEKALEYHLRSLNIRIEKGYTYSSSWSHHNLGRTHLALGNLDQAEEHLKTAVKIRQEGNAPAEALAPQLELIKVYSEKGADTQIVPLIEDVIAQSQKFDRFKEQTEAYQLLREHYQNEQNWQLALEATNQFMQSKFELLEKQANTGVAFYAAQLNLATKERDIAQLTREKELHRSNSEAARAQLVTGAVFILVIGSLTVFFIRRIKGKNRMLSEALDNLKSTQKQLLESQKMSAMTTLVSGMAHQLNTPLGSIVTSVSYLEDKLKETHDQLIDKRLSGGQLKSFFEDATEMLSLTAKNSARAADLVARFKMISASLDESEATRFEIVDYLKQKAPLLMQNIPSGISIEIHGEPIEIYSHPQVLLKVFSHLVENSCSHGFDKQVSGEIHVDVKLSDETLEIVYQDNGSGIDKNMQEHIFDPFYTSQLGQGSMGLGLNIVYNSIVHVLQGEITFVEISDGARFVIRLPINLKREP